VSRSFENLLYFLGGFAVGVLIAFTTIVIWNTPPAPGP
jgi:hypothetical protein